jgi:hypothetical protein
MAMTGRARESTASTFKSFRNFLDLTKPSNPFDFDVSVDQLVRDDLELNCMFSEQARSVKTGREEGSIKHC